MKKCQNCGQPIEWDAYWTTWDHVRQGRKLTAELCNPELGFEGSNASTVATP